EDYFCRAIMWGRHSCRQARLLAGLSPGSQREFPSRRSTLRIVASLTVTVRERCSELSGIPRASPSAVQAGDWQATGSLVPPVTIDEMTWARRFIWFASLFVWS